MALFNNSAILQVSNIGGSALSRRAIKVRCLIKLVWHNKANPRGQFKALFVLRQSLRSILHKTNNALNCR